MTNSIEKFYCTFSSEWQEQLLFQVLFSNEFAGLHLFTIQHYIEKLYRKQHMNYQLFNNEKLKNYL